MCDDYDDELPPISVTSSTRESGALSMPSAQQLAAARAREAECEREVRALCEGDSQPADHGEDALAAAVGALRVQPRARAPPPPLAGLLRPLLADVPALAAAGDHVLDALTDHVCSASLSGGGWSPREVELAASWLMLSALATPARAGRARAALRALLDAHQLPEAGERRVAAAVVRCVRVGGVPAAALSAAGALAGRGRGRGRAGGARLYVSLLAHTLAAVLDVPPPQNVSECVCEWASSAVGAHWRRGSGAAGSDTAGSGTADGAGRVCARLLAACGAGACRPHRDRLVHALAAHRATHTQQQRLEVLVSASKLQLLFRD